MVRTCWFGGGPGRFAPALLLCLLCLAVAPSGAASAQAPARPVQTAANPVPMPDGRLVAILLRSTMAAVDHANKTGNYSVLRGLGSPGFRAANDDPALHRIFAGLRADRVDLSQTLIAEPVFEYPPAIINGQLRMRGAFRFRPVGIEFDLLYELSNGWRLHAVAIRSAPAVQRTN